MVNEKRLIDANALIEHLTRCKEQGKGLFGSVCVAIKCFVEQMPTVDAVEVPCKIGDFVWAIRNYKGHKHPQRGIVSDMYFLRDMSLQIVVKHVARGEWGKTVFASDIEAYAVIEAERRKGG